MRTNLISYISYMGGVVHSDTQIAVYKWFNQFNNTLGFIFTAVFFYT